MWITIEKLKITRTKFTVSGTNEKITQTTSLQAKECGKRSKKLSAPCTFFKNYP